MQIIHSQFFIKMVIKVGRFENDVNFSSNRLSKIFGTFEMNEIISN